MKNSLLIIPLALTVSACSGGSGGGTSAEPPADGASASVLRTFSDDAGVVRGEVTEGGETAVLLAMVPEAQEVAANFGSSTVDPTLTLEHEEEIGSNEYGTFYAGDLRVNGTAVRGIGYEDTDSPVVIAYFENSDANMLLTAGEKPSDIPSGEYVYRGTNVIGYRDGSEIEDGTFEMTVDFTNGNAQIDAQTPDTVWKNFETGETGTNPGTYMTGSDIPVDVRNGTFASNRIAIGRRGVTETDGSIYGSFHGSGATGVTGIYHDNAANPSVAGAIAGNR
ncbi:hypothetical protein [Tranquillimonas alkanivorans]|uniref:Transferrin-binding protein B C-lobe/N-lobe beta barrel domain-containing protein n=1 Tax=Tranquillimonas alkanivorans TaxID=441119 RepID=A0A1I5U1Q2_9RHOB|nr:hypothetical protein [Tranquillimonas alkanivorans]SFP89230.1 hypothetical protein SAMN04488047_1172 [Tranquillimonas alkanivorans]